MVVDDEFDFGPVAGVVAENGVAAYHFVENTPDCDLPMLQNNHALVSFDHRPFPQSYLLRCCRERHSATWTTVVSSSSSDFQRLPRLDLDLESLRCLNCQTQRTRHEFDVFAES